ncbi:lymphocyte antigen 86 isoform X1 [Pseudophryne corroboree]|uniref:lymphocyte antigen 86 isoform X1 n=1 Tax=Pseudophryne corroboree TaxID=495146 RepID=UPI0030815774
MKNFIFFLFALCFLWPGEMREWPLHTICKTKDFEAYYKSCDPLQDGGFSFTPCSRILPKYQIMRIGIVLRHDIKSLYVKLNIFYNGYLFAQEDRTLCDEKAPRYSFCGKKKGESVFYDHDVKLGVSYIPRGDYMVTMELRNEDHDQIACVNVTIYSHPLV